MDSYYQLLGIEPDADEKQLKAGYFRTIRRYSPEADPEMFKKVREAYELLQDPKKRNEYDAGLTLEPVFQKVYKRALELKKEEEYEEAIQCCKEVLSIKPVEIFQFLLARLYLLNQNEGKAIKLLEELVKTNPDNWRYRKLLAWSYNCRGWRKKSLSACADLEKAGCVDWDFKIMYGAILSKLESSETVFRMLWSMFDDASTSLEFADADMVKGAWALLCDHAEGYSPESCNELMQILIRFEAANMADPEDMVIIIQYAFFRFFTSPTQKYLKMDERLLGQISERLKDYADRNLISKRDAWLLVVLEGKLESIRLHRDKRLHKDVFGNSDSVYMYGVASDQEKKNGSEGGEEDFISPEIKVGFLGSQLDFIGDLPGIKKSFVIIKEEYPVYARALGGFLNEILTCSSRAFLLNKYEKLVKRAVREAEPFFGGMEDLFAEEHAEDMFFDSFASEEPYRRTSPKIGRNEPCPCGSGKKYKNCCGKG